MFTGRYASLKPVFQNSLTRLRHLGMPGQVPALQEPRTRHSRCMSRSIHDSGLVHEYPVVHHQRPIAGDLARPGDGAQGAAAKIRVGHGPVGRGIGRGQQQPLGQCQPQQGTGKRSRPGKPHGQRRHGSEVRAWTTDPTRASVCVPRPETLPTDHDAPGRPGRLARTWASWPEESAPPPRPAAPETATRAGFAGCAADRWSRPRATETPRNPTARRHTGRAAADAMRRGDRERHERKKGQVRGPQGPELVAQIGVPVEPEEPENNLEVVPRSFHQKTGRPVRCARARPSSCGRPENRGGRARRPAAAPGPRRTPPAPPLPRGGARPHGGP